MGIQLRRVGHVGILVSNFERSFKFYTETLGCKVTRRYTRPDGTETGFLRFEQDHHNFVIGTAPRARTWTAAIPGIAWCSKSLSR